MKILRRGFAAAVLLFLFSSPSLYSAVSPPVPLRNTFLQTPLNGNQLSITNLGELEFLGIPISSITNLLPGLANLIEWGQLDPSAFQGAATNRFEKIAIGPTPFTPERPIHIKTEYGVDVPGPTIVQDNTNAVENARAWFSTVGISELFPSVGMVWGFFHDGFAQTNRLMGLDTSGGLRIVGGMRASSFTDDLGNLRDIGSTAPNFSQIVAGHNDNPLSASDFTFTRPLRQHIEYLTGTAPEPDLASAAGGFLILSGNTVATLKGIPMGTNTMESYSLVVTNPANYSLGIAGVDRWEEGFPPTMPFTNQIQITITRHGHNDELVGSYVGPIMDQWVTLTASSQVTNFIINLSIPKQVVSLSGDVFILHATNFPPTGFSKSCVVKFLSNASNRDFRLNSAAGFKTNAVNSVSNTIPSGWKYVATFSADGPTVDFNHAVQSQ